jgi:ubiquinone biosynthesis protein
VLSRHGLGYLINRFGLEGRVPFHRGLLGHAARSDPYTNADHLRLALEELGTAAIKLGQILSTRPDLLPPSYIAELSKLRDQLPPVPLAAIQAEIERELGHPLTDLFAEFDPAPLAAASIGQVHAATLPSGERVVIKVRKPGVAELVEVDLDLLLDLAGTAQRHSAFARQYDLVAIVEEFAWTLRGELDYMREGRNADRFHEQFADNPDIVIPRVYWSHTTSRVLTMQRLTGVGIGDIDALADLHIDQHDLAVRSANLVLSQIFEHGFYHADPHPGNFLVLRDGAIGALDFGMVGRLSGRMQLDLLELMAAVVAEESEYVVDAFEALDITGAGRARAALVRDVGHLLERYVGLPLAEIQLTEATEQVFTIVRRYGLAMPAELVLLLKTLAMNEGVGRRLDPGFRLLAVATPFVRHTLQRRMQPGAWKPHVRRGIMDLSRTGLDLPGQVRRLSRRLDRGELLINVQHREQDPLVDRFADMAYQLVLSIVFASLVIGTSLIMVAYHPDPATRWLAWFFGMGVAGVLITGAMLARALRRGRRP